MGKKCLFFKNFCEREGRMQGRKGEMGKKKGMKGKIKKIFLSLELRRGWWGGGGRVGMGRKCGLVVHIIVSFLSHCDDAFFTTHFLFFLGSNFSLSPFFSWGVKHLFR